MATRTFDRPTAVPLHPLCEGGRLDRAGMLALIEECGRVCHMGRSGGTEESASRFTAMLVRRGHLSVLEHVSITMKVTCSRACSHQLVRHRLASYSQESQRRCAYGDPEFYLPPAPDGSPERHEALLMGLYYGAANSYRTLLLNGCSPQLARLALPNAAKTRIVATANLRQWLHMIGQRTTKAADDEIRTLFLDIQRQFREVLPEIYGEPKSEPPTFRPANDWD